MSLETEITKIALAICEVSERGEAYIWDDLDLMEQQWSRVAELIFPVIRCIEVSSYRFHLNLVTNHMPLWREMVKDKDLFCRRLQQETKSPPPLELIQAVVFDLSIPTHSQLEEWQKLPWDTRLVSFVVNLWYFTALTKHVARYWSGEDTPDRQREIMLKFRMLQLSDSCR